MKPLKFGLRVWIAITSAVSFLAGWALFSHAGKPAPLPMFSPGVAAQQPPSGSVSGAPLPTLAPIPSLDELTKNSAASVSSSNVQPLPSLQSAPVQSFAPRFRTRGS